MTNLRPYQFAKLPLITNQYFSRIQCRRKKHRYLLNNGIITPCTIASQDGRSGLSLLWSPGPVCCLVSTLFRTFELLPSHYNYNYFIAACSICSRIIHTYDSASCLRSWLLWPCYQVNAMISTSCAAIYSSFIQPSGQSLHLSGCSWKFDFRRKFNLLWVH
jgi:hypothetical protein